ncbi:hypothetical protein Tco_1530818 [Tanacetum coccineum]
MLGSMTLKLQKALKNYKEYDMIQELKTMFEEKAKQELFEIVKAFHACKREHGKTIADLHAMLKLHKKGILKKDETIAVLAIREAELKKERDASVVVLQGPLMKADNVETWSFKSIPWAMECVQPI